MITTVQVCRPHLLCSGASQIFDGQRGARWETIKVDLFDSTSIHWLHIDIDFTRNFKLLSFQSDSAEIRLGIQAIEAIFATISLAVSSGLSLVQATKGSVKSFPCYGKRFVLEFLGLIGWGKLQRYSVMLNLNDLFVRCCLVKDIRKKHGGSWRNTRLSESCRPWQFLAWRSVDTLWESCFAHLPLCANVCSGFDLSLL